LERYRTIFVSAAAAACAIGLVVLYRFDPTVAHIYPPCVFHSLTGLNCPGCGTTRALYHLLHGDVGGAFRFNPMLFAVVPFTGVSLTSRRFVTHPVTAWAAVTVTMLYWIVRNLPWWPLPL
jgi:uncharacterized protein DUF2752